MKLIKKVYEKNKPIWFETHSPELHHIYGRYGIFLCCPHFWVTGKQGHQNDWRWCRNLKMIFFPDKQKVIENFKVDKTLLKASGCKKEIFNECSNCLMPVIENKVLTNKEKNGIKAT